MRVRIVAIAAVRVRGVAVRLEDGRVGGSTLEASLAGRKLFSLSVSKKGGGDGRAGTHSSGSASANVVRKAGDVVRVAHEDAGLDGGEGVTGEGCTRTAAEGIVHDLAALRFECVSVPVLILEPRLGKESVGRVCVTRLTCEYPMSTILVSGHFVWKSVTALTTAAVPWFAESS